MRELGEDNQPDRQERRASGDRRVDHREHPIRVRRHLTSIERIRKIGLARGGGVTDGHGYRGWLLAASSWQLAVRGSRPARRGSVTDWSRRRKKPYSER